MKKNEYENYQDEYEYEAVDLDREDEDEELKATKRKMT